MNCGPFISYFGGESPRVSLSRVGMFMHISARPPRKDVRSVMKGSGLWPTGAAGKIDDSEGHMCIIAGRRVGRHAQMIPVLHSTADHIDTAREWSEKRRIVS